MSERKYRAGIVGCGAIARAHANMYMRHEKTVLVAAADINPNMLKIFAEEFPVPSTYTDYREMLDKEDLDIVSVCTWHGSHAEITIAAAKKEVKGIICEKPMAVSLGQADAMIEACEKSGTKLTVEHTRRYNPVNVEARRLIMDGVIGQPVAIVSRTSDGLLNWGTHIIDQARFLLGDPETEWVIGQVERKTDRYERAVPIEDLCMGLICFSNGARLIIECDLPGPEFPVGLNTPLVYGSEGMMIPLNDRLLLLTRRGGWREMTFMDGGDGLLKHLDELIRWIEGEVDDHRCSGRQARYTMEIMMAIYESLRIKGLVRMPLKTKDNPLEMMIKDGTLPVEKPGKYDIRIPSPFWSEKMKKAYENFHPSSTK
jgi:predicted dehydrogenase